MWLGIIHHVYGEHEWEDGECSHGQLTEQEGGKDILAKDSKPADELRKIVFDADWLRTLERYVKFKCVCYSFIGKCLNLFQINLIQKLLKNVVY